MHHGRVVKRTGDGVLIEFRSVVDAVRCAIEVQNGMAERNTGLPPERRIEFRVGIHLGDVVEESDGDLMGDAVNIDARLEGSAKSGAPIKVVNDAAMQALGCYNGGSMLFLGLGTGLGTAMIVDGNVEPMELGHLPYKKATYEDYLGRAGLKRLGKKRWRHHVDDVVQRLIAALEPDALACLCFLLAAAILELRYQAPAAIASP
jgi:hypothetical protein